jgi:hypothetical protein
VGGIIFKKLPVLAQATDSDADLYFDRSFEPTNRNSISTAP